MKKSGLFVLAIFMVFSSCKKKSENALWNVQALTPLVQTSLTLDNIIKDTSVINKNPDQTLSVVVREEVANVTTDSLVTLRVKPYTKKVKLSSLVLSNQTIVREITLQELADQLKQAGNPLGDLLLALGGSGLPFDFTPITGLSVSDLTLDIKQFFDDATFITGTMEIKIDNNLPLAIDNLAFNAANAVGGQIIANQVFNSIPPGGSATQVVDLAGKTVEGNLILDITQLDLGGGNGIIINLSDAIVLNITISNVSLSAATAIFPAQNVIDATENIILQGMGEVELYEAWIASGTVKAVITSTIESPFDVTYSIPGAVKNGVPFEISRTIAAAQGNVAEVEEISESFAEYKMNLRGALNDTVNKFTNRLVGALPYTGQKVYITLTDSVDVVVTMEDPIPSYVRGYLGRDTAQIGPANISLDLFSKIESGILNFEEATINMVIENNLGITGAIKINNVSSRNAKGDVVTMSGPYIGNIISINKATDNPLTPTAQTINLSGGGSNAIDLLNILPNQFTYDVQVISNPGGNDLTYSDFAYSTGGLKAYLDIEMPLSFYATDLVLSDTATFNAASIRKKSVNKGTFTVHADNGFPLDASLKIDVLDQRDTVITSLISPSILIAASLDGTGRVTTKTKSMISYEIDEETMHILYSAAKFIFKVSFTTQPNATHVKLYSDYAIDFKLVGDMNYSIY